MNQDIISLIERKRRQLIVHSTLYYRFDTNIWSDGLYDKVTKELVKLQNDNPEEAKAARYEDGFVDFTGATGYHLPDNHPYMYDLVNRLRTSHEQAVERGDFPLIIYEVHDDDTKDH